MVFPLWNEFKAQQELGAWLTIKLGKTRLKWQLACGEEPSLLSRSGIRPRTDTADQTAITRLGHGEIIGDVIGDVIDDVIGDVIEKSLQSNLLIYDFYNHWRQKNTIEI